MVVPEGLGSPGQREERLTLFDDSGGEFHRVGAADIHGGPWWRQGSQ
jgi:hypothetical protein